ncbi:MAG: putative DNA binding domain-containing protein, partial [Prevotellaceae bacterium]|nr:putative DNA binding domain-containing protein [Prevotellaceae bacterium]
MNILPDRKSQTVEFKLNFNEEVIETLAAFATTEGGKVYVGMSDDGRVIGVTLEKGTTQQWLNEIESKTDPLLLADAKIVTIDNKEIVILSIDEYPIKPVAIGEKCYERVGDSIRLLPVSEVVNLHLKTFDTSWDACLDCVHAESDLSIDKILSAMEIIRKNGVLLDDNPMTFLQKYSLIRDGKITCAAYWLFKKDDSCETAIELERFQTEIIIEDSVRTKSDVITQVSQVIDFVKKHTCKEPVFESESQTTERWLYPLEALREVIVNMIVHRDYRSTAGSIVKVFNDRIEFWNPGSFPPYISIEDLYNNTYSSNPRNKIIADVFKDMKWIEKVGTGYKRIFEYFNAKNLKLPKIEIRSRGVLITVFAAFEMGEGEISGEAATEVVLNVIKSNPKILQKQIAEKLKITEDSVYWHIKRLKDKGVIKRGAKAD